MKYPSPSIRSPSHRSPQHSMSILLVLAAIAVTTIVFVDSFTPFLQHSNNKHHHHHSPLTDPKPTRSSPTSTVQAPIVLSSSSSSSRLYMAAEDESGAPKKKKKTVKKKKKTVKKKKATKKKKAAAKETSTVASAKKQKAKAKKATKKKKQAKSTKAKKTITATTATTATTAAAVTVAAAAATTTNLPPLNTFPPSKITNDDTPTPPIIDHLPEPITSLSDSIPNSQYDAKAVPVPHQPWRRGDTDGCEDPITAEWRIEAEELIHTSAYGVGGTVTDITWYMGALVITIDDTNLGKVHSDNLADINVGTPEIRVYDDDGPMWFDPDDPEPEDDYGIYEGEEDGRIEVEDDDGSLSSGIPNDPYLEREFDEVTGTFLPPPVRPTREEAVRNIGRDEYEEWKNDGMKVEMIDRDDRVGKQKMTMEDFHLKLEELRATTTLSEEEMDKRAKDLRAWYLRSEDLAEYYPDEFEKVGHEEALNEKLAMPILERADGVDTGAISIIAKAIIDALEDDDVEERLAILSRHEIVMTSPGPDNYVETQREFDESRGKVVNVQTQDPFGSNRVLTGKLVDRNALDVHINVMGRLVTVPLNMVAHVTLLNTNTSEDIEEEEAVGAL